MRVTDLTKQKSVISNINNNTEKLQNLMVGMSTGKRINKPSDDPVGAALTQDYRTTINHVETINKNIVADRVWIDAMESNVAHAGNLLKQAKVLTLQAANGATSAEARAILGEEVIEIFDDLYKAGNAKAGKLYYFSGTKTFTQPLVKQKNISDATIISDRVRIKSNTVFMPAKQEDPIPKLENGTIEFSLRNLESGEITTIPIEIEKEDSFISVIRKINHEAIEDENFTESLTPIGFKTKFYAQAGADHSLFLEIDPEYELSFSKDTAGLIKAMDFGVLGASADSYTGLPHIDENAVLADKIHAHFLGYSNQKYIARVHKGGKLDQAQIIISDDGGKTWGPPQILTEKNEIYNSEGLPNQNVKLLIDDDNEPFFWKGTEFHFNQNPVVKYKGNNQIKEVLLHSGIKTPISITANDLFFKRSEETVNVFDLLYNISSSMKNDDQKALTKSLEFIDLAIEQVLTQRAQIGVVGRQLGTATEKLGEENFSKTKELSELEDMDFPKAVMDLNTTEVRHKASLDAGARLIQPTLLNFLK